MLHALAGGGFGLAIILLIAGVQYIARGSMPVTTLQISWLPMLLFGVIGWMHGQASALVLADNAKPFQKFVIPALISAVALSGSAIIFTVEHEAIRLGHILVMVMTTGLLWPMLFFVGHMFYREARSKRADL